MAASVVLIKDLPSHCCWRISHTLATLTPALKGIIKAHEDAIAFKNLRRCQSVHFPSQLGEVQNTERCEWVGDGGCPDTSSCAQAAGAARLL